MLKIDQIKADADAVLDLSKHIIEFKEKVFAFKDRFKISGKDYITPSDEDFLTHSLVSYWKSRLALLEITNAIQKNLNLKDIKHKDNEAAFVVGYTSMVTLVDTARFLYDQFEDWPLGKKKLNQSLPSFGIPAGVYDTIQESLVNIMNIERMRGAHAFYGKIKPNLSKLTSEHHWLKPLIKIIESYDESDNMSFSEIAAKSFFAQTRFIAKLAESPLEYAVYSIQESVSRAISLLKTRPHSPHIPEEIQKELEELMKSGDVFITRKEFAMTNYFLPGYWPHAVLYLGNEEEMKAMKIPHHPRIKSRWEDFKSMDTKNNKRVLEALKDGVHIRSMESPYFNDNLCIIRPKLTSEEIAKAFKRGIQHEGKSYDFDFDFNRSDRLVCTEVVYRTYDGIGEIDFKLSERAMRKNLSAEDLLNLALKSMYFELIAVYCPAHSKKVAYKNEAKKILKATIGKKA